MALIPLGRFRELSVVPTDPSIFDTPVHPESVPELVLTYLDAAKSGIDCMQWCMDPFDGSSIGPLSLLTDGVYAWRSDLSYFVRRRGIALPKAFIEHASGAKWPANVSPLSAELEEALWAAQP